MEENHPADVRPTTKWEMRLQAQEEEVMLLKSVLRDVLQRLQNLEIHSNPGNSCNSNSSVVQSVKDTITPSKTCSTPKKDAQEITTPLRITVGTQTEWPLIERGSKESLDTLDENLLCEMDSLNGETADVITDYEEAQVVDKVFQSPAPEEAGAATKSISALRQNKKELLRRNSSSDKLVREARDRSKKLERKSVSTANLLNASSGSRRGNYNLEGVSIKVFLRGRPITMYIPSNIQNHDDQKPELPSEKLQLEWVYGCRGRDSRCTLRMLQSGEVIYFTACVIVICDEPWNPAPFFEAYRLCTLFSCSP